MTAKRTAPEAETEDGVPVFGIERNSGNGQESRGKCEPGLVEGRIEPREYLCVTASFDHDVVDGVPAARFVTRFRELVEAACGLDAL